MTVFPDGPVGAVVPAVLLGRVVPGVCNVAALGATAELLLPAVAPWPPALAGPEVTSAAAGGGVGLFATLETAAGMAVGGAPGLFVTMVACGWVGPAVIIVAVVTLAAVVAMAAVGFAVVGGCEDLFSFPALVGTTFVPAALGLLLTVV